LNKWTFGTIYNAYREEGIPLTDEAANKVRAEIRARQAEDGKKAMAEYEASAAATRAKTEKLRALRLARDAADAAAPKPPAKTKAKAKTAKKKVPAGKLSDWLDGQADSGRST
jgi:DNA-binding protein H-NS